MKTENDKRNTSGVRGVSWKESAKCWVVTMTYNKKSKVYQEKGFTDAVAMRLYLEQCCGYTESPAKRYMDNWVMEQKALVVVEVKEPKKKVMINLESQEYCNG